MKIHKLLRGVQKIKWNVCLEKILGEGKKKGECPILAIIWFEVHILF